MTVLTRLDHQLITYARLGDENNLVTILAQEPQWVHAVGAHGRTLLWEAAAHGHLPVVKALVKLRADINRVGGALPLPPFAIAMVNDHGPVARFLLRAGADLDIYAAARLGYTAHVRDYLRANPTLVNQQHPAADYPCATPLRYAIDSQDLEMVQLLLDAGSMMAGCDHHYLHHAALSGQEQVIHLLLRQGANPRGMPMYGLILVEFPQIARRLLALGADVNGVPAFGDWPPLVFESRGDRGNHPERIRALLENGADVNIVGQGGRTALHSAAQAGFAAVIDVLLEYGAALELRNDKDQTPLAVAVGSKNVAGAYALLDAGADPNVAINRSQSSPLHHAAKHGPLPLIDALLRAGANPMMTDKHGRTPLDLARRAENVDAVTHMLAYMVNF